MTTTDWKKLESTYYMQVVTTHRRKCNILQLSLFILSTEFEINIIGFYISSIVNFAKFNSLNLFSFKT